MAAIIQAGISGLTFGVKAETGVLVTSVQRNAQSGSKEASGIDGDIIAHVAYGFKADYTISAHTTGITGLAGAQIGSVFALANKSDLNGVSGGSFVVKILWDWPLAMINVFEHCQLYSQGVRLAGSSNTDKVTEAVLKLKQRVRKWICP